MEVWQGLDAVPAEVSNGVTTIGFFDGVHRGHREVIRRTVERAREGGVPAIAVTFDRHPREVLTPANAPQLLTTLRRKAELIASLGIDGLLVLPFTEEFSRWPAEQFVERVLVRGVRAVQVVVGANFTFGYKAMGTIETLRDLGNLEGFEVEDVDLLRLGERPVSSSSIRQALAEGDLEWPREALGRVLPGDGVYAGKARVGSSEWVAAMNVGTNPTFGAEPRHLEAFLLDFEGDLRGRVIGVEFWFRLRDEERFESAEALAEQIARDVERTRELVR